jgi:hypothetical protein
MFDVTWHVHVPTVAMVMPSMLQLMSDNVLVLLRGTVCTSTVHSFSIVVQQYREQQY